MGLEEKCEIEGDEHSINIEEDEDSVQEEDVNIVEILNNSVGEFCNSVELATAIENNRLDGENVVKAVEAIYVQDDDLVDSLLNTREDDHVLEMVEDGHVMDDVGNEHLMDNFVAEDYPVYIVQEVDSAKRCIMIFFVSSILLCYFYVTRLWTRTEVGSCQSIALYDKIYDTNISLFSSDYC